MLYALFAREAIERFFIMSSTRLGGFKVLKDVVRLSLVFPEEMERFPAGFFQVISDAKINLPYATCVRDDHTWGLNILAEAPDGMKLSRLIEENFRKKTSPGPKSVILSIFPHKKNPEITGSLFEAFAREGVEPEALANSPSAISVVLKEEALNRASTALFGPFSFSAYRTPEDWKLAQKGKEQLYKEVVASYQEQRPKVYGLEYQDGQELLRVRLNSRNIGDFGVSFKEFSRLGLRLTFLATDPCEEEEMEKVVFCLPNTDDDSHTGIIGAMASGMDTESITPVATFSMNGPHFGDRYGIVTELLTSLDNNGVELLGLSCTIASITGAVPSPHLESTIQAIQACFDVPTVIEKT
jgi:aspartokinase